MKDGITYYLDDKLQAYNAYMLDEEHKKTIVKIAAVSTAPSVLPRPSTAPSDVRIAISATPSPSSAWASPRGAGGSSGWWRRRHPLT